MKKIENLIDGFARFQQQYYEDAPALYRELRDGQHPTTLLIGCCDSRVDPAMLLGCDPGDIFTMRNIANLVPPPTADIGPQGVLAAIQFAVEDLQVERVIVLGHSQCGGIRALMQGRAELGRAELGRAEQGRAAMARPEDFVQRWMAIAEPARQRVAQQLPRASDEERHRACEQASILISLQNLQCMHAVQRRLADGSLSLHGWYFDIACGSLMAYSPRADAFLPIFCPT